MKKFIAISVLISNPVWSIEACSEHGYCNELGIPQVIHSPQFTSDQNGACSDTTFHLHFELDSGRPINVEVVEGPSEYGIRDTIKKSFESWRYNGTVSIKSAKEVMQFDSLCRLKEHVGIKKILESEQERQ